jgi:hypothetical protein
MAMTIDAIDLLYGGKVDGFGIMSSDSDFTPLVTRLRQDGLLVYGFGGAKAPEAFRTVCTRYIDIDQLVRTEAAVEDQPEGATQQVDRELIELLGAAWKAASFDVRNYGYKRLSDLMRATGDHFKLERRDNELHVKRVR